MKPRLALFSFLSILMVDAYSQNTDESLTQQATLNPITTAVPFLRIASDARAGAMGDVGVASSPDAYSMHWNAAKYAFIEKDMGFGISYSPWLKELIPDINLACVNFFKKLDDEQTIAASLLYFSLGNIAFTDDIGLPLGVYNPNEFSLDFAYSRKLSERFSASVTGRFIFSDLTQGQYVAGSETHAGTSIAADVSFYWRKDVSFANSDGILAFGINISNIGSKISYSPNNNVKDFIPTNLRFGPSLLINVDDYNSISFVMDVNKLLVPTPPVYKVDPETGQPIYGEDNKLIIEAGQDPDVSVVSGMFQSFFDAPGGFSEELREFSIGTGIEYWYDKQFALRVGYFYEHKSKGNRKFFTLGAGLKYNVFGLDVAYLAPLEQRHPLGNTLRFSLLFDFEAFK
ncbi:MAG: type IX secretion system outer membrane channel protein PorV [Bacteroidetes bacterium]|nr:type IX secretion system outer membrane channel protein PorV [Bacteroidota bacterium]